MRCLLAAALVMVGLTGPALLHAGDAAPLRLTAVVTDAKGAPLPGLKPADFELVVDGAPQAVEAVQLARDMAAAPRAVAIVLDEFHVAADDSALVRDEMLRFVDTYLRPGDVALVFKPLDSLDAIAMRSDRDALREAISAFEGRKGDYAPRTDFERRYMAQAPTAVATARAQIVTSALRAIATTLSQQGDATPLIVLVSDGFGRMRAHRDTPAALQAAIRLANRAGAPIYAFAPGLARPAPDEDAPAFTALQAVTSQTGGQLTTGRAGLRTGLAAVVRDLDARYVLMWQPAHAADGRFHEVRLSTRRAGAQVRTQAGYIAAPPAETRPPVAATASAPLRVLRRSALIQSWSGFFPSAADRGTVMVTWEPAPPRATAAARASTVVLTASTAQGDVLFDAAIGPAGGPGSPDLPNAATFEAPPGPVHVDIKILDAAGVVIDTDARDVALPPARGDRPTIYPAAFVRTRSAREFRDALDNTLAPPVATRDFRRTDRLLIRVPALGPSGEPVPVSATLMNRWRQPMRDLTALEPAGPPHTTQFDLPLASLAPGEYSLRLTVSSAAGAVVEVIAFRVQG